MFYFAFEIVTIVQLNVKMKICCFEKTYFALSHVLWRTTECEFAR